MGEHLVDVTRGADRRNPPEGARYVADFIPFREAVRDCGIRRSKRRIAIMSALATGWLPWGVEWGRGLPLCDRRYVLCCGHVLGAKEAQQFVDAGLLMAGEPDQHGRPTLVITEAGREWLNQNW